jgi:hypothetical protein
MKLRIMALTAAFAVCFATSSSAQTPPTHDEQSRPAVVVEVSQGGFDWGDAAIGAVAASGMAIALAGLSMVLRRESQVGLGPERRETR